MSFSTSFAIWEPCSTLRPKNLPWHSTATSSSARFIQIGHTSDPFSMPAMTLQAQIPATLHHVFQRNSISVSHRETALCL